MAIVYPKTEYRVEEYNGFFVIQRKEVEITITRYWFKKIRLRKPLNGSV